MNETVFYLIRSLDYQSVLSTQTDNCCPRCQAEVFHKGSFTEVSTAKIFQLERPSKKASEYNAEFQGGS